MTTKQIAQLLTQADNLLGEAMRACKSPLAREDIKDAQFKIDDALTREENHRGAVMKCNWSCCCRPHHIDA